jgi:hypothetical protein
MAINEKIDLNPYESSAEQVKERTAKVKESPVMGAAEFKYSEEEMALSKREKPDIKDLNKDIMSDVAKTQVKTKDAWDEMGIGIAAANKVDKIAQKGIRIGGKMVDQNKYNHAVNMQAEAVGQLSAIVSRANGLDQKMVATHMTKKMNNLRLELMKKAAEMQKLAAKQKWDAKKKKAAGQMWGSIAGSLAGAAIGGYFGGGMGAAAGARTGGQAGGNIGGGMSS